MHVKNALRWLAGLGVAGAWVAATAIPAGAAAPAELAVYVADTTVAIGGPGLVDGPTVAASESVVLHEPTMTFDATDLAGVVDVAEPDGFGDCTSPSARVLVCTKPYEVSLDEGGLRGLFDVVLEAAPGAEAGDSGKLKVTFGAQGLAPVSHEGTVRVGDGVDVAAGPDVKLSAAPGQAFTASPRVANVGETAVEGVTVLFENDEELHPGTRYSNCRYSGDDVRSCTFGGTLRPGATYAGAFAFVLDPANVAPSDELASVRWLTNAEYEDLVAYLEDRGVSPGEPGTEGEVALTEVAGVEAGRVQADIDPFDNSSLLEITVTGQHGVDLAAVGDTAAGAAGDTVAVEVGVVNNGPADLDTNGSGEPVTSVRVAIPTGTTAVAAPAECFPLKGGGMDPDHPGEPGARDYLCLPAISLAAGEADLVTFQLRIDEVLADATGTVTINGEDAPTFERDTDPANDTAKIVVNPSGGGGGGLPVTGAATGAAAAAGGLLLAAGVAGYVIARRRRLRFIA
ncbi:LPXTG cell wall anchor domain-containing protein [Phytohabitans sp. ZYX-F-186]|uniref:LPXTG cell wall anchor domain-containing protein n=1 Tax=Phytohabitans maris TaxID=3071409 RepID=A0ABU0ZAM8_9ACTN|nr:LPXTG cell wall anchor domain-containing protein [Phytohabitans sp. ZYX-F-186]MDQ7904110.1 LPXTG cell wall anchor domain-containing protein [Phytohabitans sp. ZYX-F-186]